ncbi:hypothetical protein TRICI_002341 [Trichomonascus ciferrii]|uniref:BZIP domain-containing protein n=1 Tax=Trichomonascus ciferrii TaxID=44093 RepID=A0A642VC34_9ASCO|nr:hypothetical protein TRICI_002341 [Trichomonascus ciferrii]
MSGSFNDRNSPSIDCFDLLNSSPDILTGEELSSRCSNSPEDGSSSSYGKSLDTSSSNGDEVVGLPPGYVSRERRSAIVLGQKTAAKSKIDQTDWAPIVVKDPTDRKALRRARNTESARRSRAKKNERIEMLQQLVHDLQARNKELEIENSILKQFVPSNI